MLDKVTLNFFTEIAENNDREWFLEHKSEYQEILSKATEFSKKWIDALGEIHPSVLDNDPKKSIFRIYNDVRFSKNKLPYKSHLGMAIGRGGRTAKWAGWYLHIEPGNKSFMGAGKWMPEAAELKSIRQEIDYNLDEFISMIQDSEIVKNFGSLNRDYVLKKAPKDYPIDHPAIEYLKLKCFFLAKKYTDEEILQSNFNKKVIEDSKLLNPFVNFLNTALEDVLLKEA